MSEILPPLPIAQSSEAQARQQIEDNLRKFARAVAGPLSDNTARALKADTAIFTGWCAEQGREPLPASPESVTLFIDMMTLRRKPATVRRYVSSIARLHKAADLPDPTKSETVRLALERMGRVKSARQEQVAGLTFEHRTKMIEAAGPLFRDLRDITLLSVAYDTLARRSELVALEVSDLTFAEDGSGTLLIRRSKTGAEGQGSLRYLAPDTVTTLKQWLFEAAIGEGKIFRSVRMGDNLREALDAGSIPRIFKQMAAKAGLPGEIVAKLSGHSTRVGAAQDMVAAGLEVTEVMQAGGWKSPVMVARYSGHMLARRGAAAKLAEKQGRAGEAERGFPSAQTDPETSPES